MMSFIKERISLPDDIFRLIRDMVYNYCGVSFDNTSKFLMESRLQHSVSRLGFDNFRDYYYYLKYDKNRDEEFIHIIDILTIHETYFFREEEQLKAFSEEILPEIIENKAKNNEKRIRVWSAGCSTGEEPYSIAMLMMENSQLKDWDCEVFGTDVSQRVLQLCRRGIYQKVSFRCTDPKYIYKYFHKEEDTYKIDDKVKKNVTFFYLNLFDQNKLVFITPADIIFCRNVIIYFDPAAKKKVVDIFYNKLKKNGFLLLGHSESLMNISTSFSLRHLKRDMVYQKKGN
ncbi:MAG: CheR family methyltransferase [Nitrospirota bacterium]